MRQTLGLFVALILLLGPVVARTPAAQSEVREQDEVWLVSTRHIGAVADLAAVPLRVERLTPGEGWHDATLDDLVAQTGRDDAPLLVYVHGNRVPRGEAGAEGHYVYRQLTACSSDAAPVRFVIWSWPSAPQRGPLRDARAKAQRTEFEGYCLGWFLSQLPQTQRVSLLGYSFGARIASGSLQLRGGGTLCGRTLPPDAPSDPHPVRVVMLAAALPNTWLRPGAYHQAALLQLDYLLNLFNHCDPVLKRYHLVSKHSHATALGFAGMYAADLGDMAQRIEQCDVSPAVQKSHELDHYLTNPCLLQRMSDVLFWHATTSASTPLTPGQPRE